MAIDLAGSNDSDGRWKNGASVVSSWLVTNSICQSRIEGNVCGAGTIDGGAWWRNRRPGAGLLGSSDRSPAHLADVESGNAGLDGLLRWGHLLGHGGDGGG